MPIEKLFEELAKSIPAVLVGVFTSGTSLGVAFLQNKYAVARERLSADREKEKSDQSHERENLRKRNALLRDKLEAIVDALHEDEKCLNASTTDIMQHDNSFNLFRAQNLQTLYFPELRESLLTIEKHRMLVGRIRDLVLSKKLPEHELIHCDELGRYLSAQQEAINRCREVMATLLGT